MRSLLSSSLPLCLPLLLLACGGAKNASLFDQPIDTPDSSSTEASTTADTAPAVDTGSGGGDTGGGATDTTPPPGVTLDNVCAKLTDAYCTGALEGCCKDQGLAWNEAGCRAAVGAVCDARVKAVKAGQATFNPAALTPCQNAWNNMATRCTLPLLDYVKNQAFCSQLFVGTQAPASSCAEDWQCKVAAGAVPDCNSSNRCETATVSDKDQPCAYTGAVRAYCDYGLACQFASGATGTCKAAKGVGASCNNSLECGLGYTCEKMGAGSSGKCAVGQPMGAFCLANDACASGQCAGGRCTDPDVSIVSTFVCSGTG